MDMDFLNSPPSKRKGGPKRGWRCPEHDPPAGDCHVEIIGQRDNVMRAFYTDGQFFIAAYNGNMVVSYENPMGWRVTG